MLKRSFRGVKFKFSRPMAAALASGLFLGVVYFWRLGHLTHGFSAAELSNIQASHSLHALFHSPVNAPHNILIYALLKLHHSGALYMRAGSAAFGLLFMACFYKICRSWFGVFVSWLTTLVIGTLPLVVLSAHSATADIMYLVPLVPVALYFELSHRDKPSKLLFALLIAATSLALYTPGVIWLLILSLFVAKGAIKNTFADYSKLFVSLNVLGFLIILLPLALSVAQSWVVIKPLVLTPAAASALSIIKAISWMASGLVWRTAGHTNLQIGRLPVLNLSEVALAVFGTYAFWHRARSKITGLVALVIVGIIGAGLSGQLSLLLFSLVAVGLAMAAGLRYLLIEWQGIFPRNPLPRALALILVCLVASMNVYFGLRYSLVAWPHTLATKQTYVLK